MTTLRFLPALYLVAAALSAASDDSLVGVWSSQRRYDRAPEGRLTVNREGERWLAAIGGQSREFQVDGNAVRFEFADGVGRYRGRLSEGGIEGFWIRPAVTQDPRFPGGSSQAYAIPVDLAPVGQGVWEGEVKTLPDTFTLYLRIFRNEDGDLMAAFRNPEQNSHGPASQFRVAPSGDTVRFMAGGNPSMPEFRLEARHLADPDRLRIHWDEVAADIDLRRQTIDEAKRFFARPPGSPAYVYGVPATTDDGWRTARAREVGIDEAAVVRAVQSIIDGDPAARRPSLIHSFLVARKGKLIVDEYFFGYDRDTPHDLRSAGKTFASVLLGTAIRDGEKIGPDSTIAELMAGRGPFANPDPRKGRITLAQLLTHSAGLACDDNDDTTPGNENTMQAQREQPDWWKYTLDLKMVHDPGERYAYCSANINLVGGALTTVTGAWLPELFERKIARPLQFGQWHWNLAPNGEGYLGGGSFIRPRDLLKIGQAYLDGGTWNGRPIVDAAWVQQSTAPRMTITPATTGLSPDEFGNFYLEGADGLAWHRMPIHSGDRSYDAYAATGNGGQLLYVVPELDLTAVFTGGNYLQGGIWLRWADQLLGGQIIPAIARDDAE